MKRLFDIARATRRVGDAAERCELCAQLIAAEHEHLYDPRARQVRCACQGCALIIPTSTTARYLRVSKRRQRVALDTATWLARFGVPVGIAAVVVHADDSGRGARAVSAYPGPAGLVESEIDDADWAALRAELSTPLAPEVEALIVSNLSGDRRSAWLVGIDVLFQIVAELRASWQGISGGPEAPASIARVLARLESAP
jgi:hypothetical protein